MGGPTRRGVPRLTMSAPCPRTPTSVGDGMWFGRGRQGGQTLVVFALVLSLVFVWMIALVADVGVLDVAYNRIDDAALLAAQSGASAVDTAQLYQGRLRLDVTQARLFCQQSLQAQSVRGDCGATTPTTVVADVRQSVRLPLTMLGQDAVIHVRHTARPAFGRGTGLVTTSSLPPTRGGEGDGAGGRDTL